MASSENDLQIKAAAYKKWSQDKQRELDRINKEIEDQIKDFDIRTKMDFLKQRILQLSKLAETSQLSTSNNFKDVDKNIAEFKKDLEELTRFARFAKESKINLSPSSSRVEILIPIESQITEIKEIPLTGMQKFANFFIAIGRFFGSKTEFHVPKIEKNYDPTQKQIDEQIKSASSVLETFKTQIETLKPRILNAESRIKGVIENLQNISRVESRIESRDGNLEVDGEKDLKETVAERADQKNQAEAVALKPEGPVAAAPAAVVARETADKVISEIFKMKELFSASMDMPGSEDIKEWEEIHPKEMKDVITFSKGLRDLLNVVDLVEPVNPVPKKMPVQFDQFKTEIPITAQMDDKTKQYAEEYNAELKAYYEKIKHDWEKYQGEVKVYDEKMKLKDTYQEAVANLLLSAGGKGDKLREFLNTNPKIAEYLSKNLSSLKTAAESFEIYTMAARDFREKGERHDKEGKPIRKEERETGNLASIKKEHEEKRAKAAENESNQHVEPVHGEQYQFGPDQDRFIGPAPIPELLQAAPEPIPEPDSAAPSAPPAPEWPSDKKGEPIVPEAPSAPSAPEAPAAPAAPEAPKAEPSAPAAPPPRNPLLESIRKGVTLKKPSEARTPSPLPSPSSDNSAVNKILARRGGIAGAKEDDEFDDDMKKDMWKAAQDAQAEKNASAQQSSDVSSQSSPRTQKPTTTQTPARSSTSPKPEPDRGGLLAAIRAGKALKKAEVKKPKIPPTTPAQQQKGLGGILNRFNLPKSVVGDADEEASRNRKSSFDDDEPTPPRGRSPSAGKK